MAVGLHDSALNLATAFVDSATGNLNSSRGNIACNRGAQGEFIFTMRQQFHANELNVQVTVREGVANSVGVGPVVNGNFTVFVFDGAGAPADLDFNITVSRIAV